jgi:GTP-binding protein Era
VPAAPPFGSDLPPGHRAGFVSIVGRPNVGKSTLLNRILGRKIAAVTPKPQTTRRRLLGIKTRAQSQLLFLDTPGIHATRDLLSARMVERAVTSLGEADAALFVVAAPDGLTASDRDVARRLPGPGKPVVVAVNKIDAVAKAQLLPHIAAIAELLPDRPVVPVSAETGENVEELLRTLEALLPPGPRYYPPDELTDEPERAIAAEIVREKVMLATRDEVPYAVAVSVDAFKEKPEKHLVVISATIHVARPSQKPIIIGERGARLKQIGQSARRELEAFLGTRVYLELFVRVQANWPEKPARLRDFGL